MTVDILADVNRPMPLHDEIRRLRGLLQGEALGKKDRQLCRYLLVRLGLEAGLAGQAEWQQFAVHAALETRFRLADDWIATRRALEVMPTAGASWSYACSLSEDEIDPSILQTLMDLKPVDAGPNIEEKYRVSGITSTVDGLQIQLSPITWHLGQSFHRAIMEQPGKFIRIAGRQPVPIPLGASRFPGLAVVHCIVVTADRQILLSQRSDTVAYDPLHWSASYEEQVTTEDFDGTDSVFQRCARRGLREEFGIDVALL
jgi:hypothetical protein